jgi:hypothetical protein
MVTRVGEVGKGGESEVIDSRTAFSTPTRPQTAASARAVAPTEGVKSPEKKPVEAIAA